MTQPDATDASALQTPPLTVDELTTDWLQFAMSDVVKGETIEEFSAEVIGVGAGFIFGTTVMKWY